MAKGVLIGKKIVDFMGKEGNQVKFTNYIILKKIEKFGEGQECFEVNSKKDFDVVIGEDVEVVYDIGFGGKAVCKDIVSAEL